MSRSARRGSSAEPSGRPEIPSVYVADGTVVREVALPVPSPIPVLESLKARLASGNVAAALELVDPSSRPQFEEMYTAIAGDLAIDAAAMESFAIDLLREDFAIVQILSTEGSGSGARVVEYPVHLRRDEDGSWLIVDY